MAIQLLILTQKLDRTDPVLGFFHRSVEELAKHCGQVTVIALGVGSYALPENVRVYSLGKERGVGRLAYLRQFCRLVWSLRHDYDSVFVHMNEEYVLLAGWWWRLVGKQVVLWRNHKQGSWRTRLATALANIVCYTSPAAFVASARNARQMPVGIDTSIFIPPIVSPAAGTVLFFGRLDEVKRPDLFVAALLLLREEKRVFSALLCGAPTDEGPFAKRVRDFALPLMADGVLAFTPAIRHDEAPALYQRHTIYVNLTPSGSFDKTILEALACGTTVVAANEVVRDLLPESLFVKELTPTEVARALGNALTLSVDERVRLAALGRAYVEEHHSLTHLIETLMPLFA